MALCSLSGQEASMSAAATHLDVGGDHSPAPRRTLPRLTASIALLHVEHRPIHVEHRPLHVEHRPAPCRALPCSMSSIALLHVEHRPGPCRAFPRPTANLALPRGKPCPGEGGSSTLQGAWPLSCAASLVNPRRRTWATSLVATRSALHAARRSELPSRARNLRARVMGAICFVNRSGAGLLVQACSFRLAQSTANSSSRSPLVSFFAPPASSERTEATSSRFLVLRSRIFSSMVPAAMSR